MAALSWSAIVTQGTFRSFTDSLLYLTGSVEVVTAASGLCTIRASGFDFRLTGTGFVYEDGPNGPVPTAGTISSITQIASVGVYWTLDSLSLQVSDFMQALIADRTGADDDAFESLFLGLGLDYRGTDAGDESLSPDEVDFEGTPMDLTGADDVELGGGNDLFALSLGNDTGWGEAGADTLYGEEGNDSLVGGTGNDVLDGGKGADTVDGGANRDSLGGGNGGDSLLGGDGADTLTGGGGNDTLDGGRGDDDLTGGSGSDTFHFTGDSGADTLKRFDPLADSIFIDGNVATFDTVGNGVEIAWAGGTVLVKGVALDDLDVGVNVFLV